MYNNPAYGGRAPVTNPFANTPAGSLPPGAPPIRSPYVDSAQCASGPQTSPFPNFPASQPPPSMHQQHMAPPPPAYPMQQQPQQQQMPSAAYGGAPAQLTSLTASYGAGGVSGVGGFATLNEQQIREAREMSSLPPFVQPSSEKLPASASVKAKTRLPFGVVFQPLGGGGQVPVVNMAGGVGTVIRCRRCRTYMNPFMKFEASGRRFLCNVCGASNDTIQTYFCALDGQGRRADRYDRPELCCGSVDYIAPGEYMSRPPQPPVYCFVIETTPGNGVQSIDAVTAAIKHWIQSRVWTEHTQVAFITYNSNVTFYGVSAASIREYVVSEIDDLFLPVASELLVNLAENESAVMQLLDNLPRILKEGAAQGGRGAFAGGAAESCLGAAIKAADLTIKHVGGKVLTFVHTLPSLPTDLALKNTKENPRLLNTERESEMLRPSNDVYEKIAAELAAHQISVDLFVGATGNYVDLATICTLAKFTGGEVFMCAGGERLMNEVVNVLGRETAWEAVMRVRVSKGWKITSFHGHMGMKGDLIVAPVVHSDQTFAIQLDLDDKETPDPIVSVQIALLYTNSNRERRIRVHNLALCTSPNAMEVNNSANADVVASLLSFTAMEMAVKSKFADARNFLNSAISGILQSAGMNCEPIKALPLLVLGLLKSPLLKATNDVPADLRVYYMLRHESAPLPLKVALMYPRMFAIDSASLERGQAVPIGEVNPQTGMVELPDCMGLTAEHMNRDGLYLVEDGESMMLWVGAECSPIVLNGLFGVPSIEQLTPEYGEYNLMISADPHARKIQNVVAQLRMDRRPTHMPLIVVPQRHFLETRFFSTLIEDRNLGMQMTYTEFLRMVGAPQVGVPPVAGGSSAAPSLVQTVMNPAPPMMANRPPMTNAPPSSYHR